MGKLVQVATTTVTSPVSSVTLTGINTDDVYMLAYSGMTCSVDTQQNVFRVTKSGTPDTTLNYDYTYKILYAGTTFGNSYASNQNAVTSTFQGTGTGEATNGILYLYNFNSSSEYSFATIEDVSLNFVPYGECRQGGFVHTVASASDGIHLFMGSGNITGGTFTLYKVL